MARAISVHQEVISFYPHSSPVNKIDLANIYAKSNGGLAGVEQMYQELLELDLAGTCRKVDALQPICKTFLL